ncbi:serine hydrolase domain-containing protein [Allorhodopirellula heiligendammensis]|nr:serine hydrolase domain-containing protein [Allorhodopirellula heiligendammensis]
MIVSTSIVTLAGLMLFACGFGYYVYSLLQVDSIDVKPDATELDRISSIDRWLDEQHDDHNFNGVVLIVRDGDVLLSKTCGFVDHTATTELDSHTALRLASVSKQFTAAGILRLAEMELLQLDDPVAKHLPGFAIEKVTIRHLLNQTSGIPGQYMSLAEKHRETFGDTLTISNVVDLVSMHTKPERSPNAAMEYSNTNYVLLAGVIEAASGVSYEEFMSEELFHPLGMHDSRVWNLMSDSRSANQAGDFDQLDDERTPVDTTWLDGVAGDGAVFCSLNDFVIWNEFWYGSPLLSDALLQQAFDRPRLSDGSRSEYGFGWMIERNRHWHNGAWLGANTYIVRYSDSRCCLVVLDNSSNLRLDAIASELEAVLQPIFLRN